MNKKTYIVFTTVFALALFGCYSKLISHTEATNYSTSAGLLFDGVDDYIEVADSPALDLTNQFSLTATFKIASADKNGYHTILSKGDRSKGSVSYRLMVMPDGTLKFEAGYYDGAVWYWNNIEGGVGVNIGIAYDKWQTIAVTYNGSNMIFYNFTENTTKTFPYTNVLKPDGYPLSIGTRLYSPYNDNFKGEIKEIRLWNTAKSSASLKTAATDDIVGNESDLVGDWVMDEGSTKQVMDLSTNGLNGISKNFAVYTATGLPFDGGDAFSLGNILPSSYTKEAWIYYDDPLNAQDNIVTGDKHAFWIESCHLSAMHKDSSGVFVIVQDPGCFPLKKWTHIAVTYDAATTTMVLYKNGVEAARRTDIPVITDMDVNIGTYNSGYWFNGRMSEVQLWDRVRSAAEIAADMQGNLTGNETGLVGLWKMDEFTTKTVYDLTPNGHNGTAIGFTPPSFTQNIGETSVEIIASSSPRKPIYSVARNGVSIGSSTLRKVTDNNLQKDMLYTYTLQAKTPYGESQMATKSIRTISMPIGTLHMDGIDDMITEKGSISYNKSVRDTFTYEFWVKAEKPQTLNAQSTSGVWGMTGQNYLVFPSHGGKDTGIAGAGVSVGSNGLSVYEHGDNYMPPLLTYEGDLSKLTHVAIVYENKTPSLYINGQFVKKGLTSTLSPYVSYQFGSSSYGYFKGEVKDFRVWSSARTPQDIRDNMNKSLIGTETGLYLNWKLDPYTTKNILDSSPNKIDAKGFYFTDEVTHSYANGVSEVGLTANWLPVTNATSYTLTSGATTVYTGTGLSKSVTGLTQNTLYPYLLSASGPNGDGQVASLNVKTFNRYPLVFDGVDDYFRTATNTNLNIKDAVTIETWFKLDKTGLNGEEKLFSKTEGGSFSASINKDWVRGYVHVGGSYLTPIFPASDIVSNQWYHLALTYDGTEAKIYLNGVLKNSQSRSGLITITGVDFLIGAEPGVVTDHFFKGVIAEVRLWDRAKTQQEIQHSMYEKYIGTEANLRGYWLIDDLTNGKINDWTGKNSIATSSGFTTSMRMEPSKVGERSLGWHWIPFPATQTYEFSRGSTLLYSGSTAAYEETGLTPETSYTYSLKAKNANGESLPQTVSAMTKQESRSIRQITDFTPFPAVTLNGQKQVIRTSPLNALSLYDYTSETTGWSVTAQAEPFKDRTNGLQLPNGSLALKAPTSIYKTASAEENLLQNSSFTYDEPGSGIGRYYWLWNQNSIPYSASITSNERSNVQKYSFTGRPAGDLISVVQNVTVKPNTKYVYSGYVKVETLSNAEVGMQLDWFTSTNTFIIAKITPLTPVGNGYMHFEISGVSPANAAAIHPYIYIKSTGNNGSATVYVDDLSLIESTNVIPVAASSSWVLDQPSASTMFTVPSNTVNAEYNIEFPTDALELTLMPNTTRIDQVTKTSEYETTITWTIASGP